MARLSPLLHLSVVALLLGGLSCPAKGPWRDSFPPDSSFSVSLPKRPKVESRIQSAEFGEVTTLTLSVTVGDTWFRAGYTEYPDSIVRQHDPDYLLGGAAKSVAERGGGVVQTERTVDITGWPGRELTILTLRGTIAITARVFLVRNRIYQLVVAVPSDATADRAIDRFLRSFQLADGR